MAGSWAGSLAVLWACLEVAHADTKCTKSGTCQWTCQTGSGPVSLDLAAVGRRGGIAFQDVKGADMYLYSYNPCFPFDEPDTAGAGPSPAECTAQDGVVVCVVYVDATVPPSGAQYDGGEQTSEEVVVTAEGTLLVKYRGSQYQYSPPMYRSSEVALQCGKTNSLTAIGEETPNSGIYKLALTTPEACVGSSGGQTSGISVGSEILAIGLPLVFVYFAGGVAFNVFYRKRSGLETVPNLGFWSALPSYIKSGFVFTGAFLRLPCCRGSSYDAL